MRRPYGKYNDSAFLCPPHLGGERAKLQNRSYRGQFISAYTFCHHLFRGCELKPYIISRFKLLAGMDIAEKRKPQDGRLRVRVAGDAVDLRVSCVPTAHGEQIVLRLLYARVMSGARTRS